jgi:thiamine pyrophosphate-dependent acetolactate synthase large subunit-like protein
MLLGDSITAVQEKIPIKVAVFDNGTLGFVELEMKVEGLLDAYTNLENPDFAKVAQAIGFHAQRVEPAEQLETAVRDWIAAPGPALLDVVTDRMELVMPRNRRGLRHRALFGQSGARGSRRRRVGAGDRQSHLRGIGEFVNKRLIQRSR